MKEEKRAQKILQILRREFPILVWANGSKEPFQTLIRVVLSQATNDKNSGKAFRNLSEKFDITPKALAEADVKEIAKAIRVGGLYRNKSHVIKQVSRLVLKRFRGNLDFVYSLPLEEARRLLMAFPGVGPKSADIVLLFCAGKPTLPVDTHVNRVSKRLRLAPSSADYEELRQAVQALYSPGDYLHVHLLLISLGRKICKAGRPLCKICPVNTMCPSRRLYD